MSMYPIYELQSFDHVTGDWQSAGFEASNRPHHYDVLCAHYGRLIQTANNERPAYTVAYRITQNGHVVDFWSNC